MTTWTDTTEDDVVVTYLTPGDRPTGDVAILRGIADWLDRVDVAVVGTGVTIPTTVPDLQDDLRRIADGMDRVARALVGLRDHGYQSTYNGRPSCPFCSSFIDDESTHAVGCLLTTLVLEVE